VARTDLIAPDQTEPLGRALYRALHERILTLPDDVTVYPTHGAGSFCSAGATGERTTTIGREREVNPLLAATSEDAFVELLSSTFGTYPPYFLRLREVNRRGPTVYGELPLLAQLDLAAFDAALAGGAELIDARPMEAYAASHIPGSLSIALRSVFASWLGWLVDADRPMVFVLDHAEDRRDLVRQALGIGYERLVGELAGGIEIWQSAGRPVTTTDLTATPDPAAPIVDVRQRSEFTERHVPGANSIELGRLVTGATSDLDDGAILMCGHGERAMTGASLAERVGKRVAVFDGGPAEWMRRVTARSGAVR
jgi:rhodanese-related sulfurtransferase